MIDEIVGWFQKHVGATTTAAGEIAYIQQKTNDD